MRSGQSTTALMTTALMTPWWCALFHRRLWEVEQVFELDYPFMRITSSWCPKCEARRM